MGAAESSPALEAMVGREQTWREVVGQLTPDTDQDFLNLLQTDISAQMGLNSDSAQTDDQAARGTLIDRSRDITQLWDQLGQGRYNDFSTVIQQIAPCYNKNMDTFYNTWVQKLNEYKDNLIVETPENGWTLDSWNNFVTATYKRIYTDIFKEPEFGPISWIFDDGLCIIVAGSAAENTATTFIHSEGCIGTDLDVMLTLEMPGEIKDIPECPGYLNIKMYPILFYPTNEDGFMYSNNFLMSYFDFYSQSDKYHAESKSTARVISGPSIGKVSLGTSINKDFDQVIGYHCKETWPPIAKEWVFRDRPSGWPSGDLMMKILIAGFCVVHASHPHSKKPDIEFRYSFSKSETLLMQNLSKKQRKCFMLTKHLCKLTFEGFKLLTTYHVKTVFLWMMETYPEEFWEENEVDALVLLLLDKLLFSFIRGNIPNYFIREANLIDEFSPDHLRTCTKKLGSLKHQLSKNDIGEIGKKSLHWQGLPLYIQNDICLRCVKNIDEEVTDPICRFFNAYKD